MLEIGTKIYEVSEVCNAFSKQRLTMLDDEGNEWYRYDKPNFEYQVKEWTVIGSIKYLVRGKLVSYEEDVEDGEIVYQLNDENGKEAVYSKYDTEDFFLNLEQAKRIAEERHAARNSS
jgi:hypothetical protein